MEFLVRIDVLLPGDLADGERRALLEAERRRGLELRAEGALGQIWRIPGRLSNVAVWQAADATELHGLICSLPVWPYAAVEVTALARHPLDD